MSGRVGVLIAGVKGAVATTAIAGVFAARRGLAAPQGMITQRPPLDDLGIPSLDSIEFGGWDLSPERLEDAARRHGVLDAPLVDAVADDLRQVMTFPACRVASATAADDDAGADSADGVPDLREVALHLERQIVSFREASGCERVVVVNLTSTQPQPADPDAVWRSLAEFERALDAGDSRVTPPMLYAYAALRLGESFVNFTPNAAAEMRALHELALREGACYAGKDGKTGQTLYKTTLASLFRVRDLRVAGWYSTNLLGNQDGAALCSSPEHASPKLASKRDVLESILGYSDFEHVVRIDYYGPRGDRKEAWDVIDFEGWLGRRMSMRVSWLGEDSILAAPVLLDAVLLTAHAHAAGEAGALQHLALLFKSPHGTRIHELVEQHRMLIDHILLQAAPRSVTPIASKPAGPTAVGPVAPQEHEPPLR